MAIARDVQDQDPKDVQIAELRRRLRSLLDQKEPVIVRKRRAVCAVILPVNTGLWWEDNHAQAESSRLKAKLQRVLPRIFRSY